MVYNVLHRCKIGLPCVDFRSNISELAANIGDFQNYQL